jgi:hypothetical protein
MDNFYKRGSRQTNANVLKLLAQKSRASENL